MRRIISVCAYNLDRRSSHEVQLHTNYRYLKQVGSCSLSGSLIPFIQNIPCSYCNNTNEDRQTDRGGERDRVEYRKKKIYMYLLTCIVQDWTEPKEEKKKKQQVMLEICSLTVLMNFAIQNNMKGNAHSHETFSIVFLIRRRFIKKWFNDFRTSKETIFHYHLLFQKRNHFFFTEADRKQDPFVLVKEVGIFRRNIISYHRLNSYKTFFSDHLQKEFISMPSIFVNWKYVDEIWTSIIYRKWRRKQ